MRITFVNRYFWPESVLVNDIARWMSDAGHDVTVLTGQPDYNPEVAFERRPSHEDWQGIAVRRLTLFRDRGRGMARNFNSVLFGFSAALHVLFGRGTDAVWSTSIPPIVQPLLLRLASWVRGAKFIYFPQDIYPEIAVASGLMKSGFAERLLRRIDTWIVDHADEVVTISNDMAELFAERGAVRERIDVIRSFSPVEGTRHMDEPKAGPPYRFVFAGNIGRFQNLDKLIECFADIDPKLAVLDLLGDGRERARLEKDVRDNDIQTVRFHDFLPVDQAFAFTRACHIGVVSLRPGIFRYAFPAKLYNAVGAGLPLLVFVERESELARLVEERGIGVAVDLRDGLEEGRAAIRELCENYDRYRANVRDRTDDLFLPARARTQWLEAFDALENGRDGRKRVAG